MKQIKLAVLLIVATTTFFSTNAQQRILLDKPVRAGELILFPELGDESKYYYLPDKPNLAEHPNGDPQLSFLRYVKNESGDAGSNNSITESEFGGGILHALVELRVEQELIKDAERALRRIDGDGKIVGPVVFKSGTIALISSVAQENGEFAQQVVGLGSAPILENQRSAVSVQLNKLGSKILWETFATPTPDFSFAFEMEVEGYLSPKRVLIEADFERIYKHETFEAAAATPVFAAEIKIAMDELHDSGAIKVTQIGEDEELNKLMETAYNQLINLMFDKIGGTGVPQLNQLMPGNQKSMLDRATENLTNARKEARDANERIDRAEREREARNSRARSSARSRGDSVRSRRGLSAIEGPEGDQRRASAEERTAGDDDNNREAPQREPIPSLSIAISYQLKKVKRTGSYRIDLNKYTETTRTMPFAYNPGNVKKQCAECFREVNLDDPLMKQREINASLGGMNVEDFSKYINFVNVLIKKKHQSGDQTVDEVKIDKSEFNKTGNFFKMLYGWKGDNDREKWLEYEYRTMWSFAGDYQVASEWEKKEFGSIALEPPLVRKPIYVEADEDFIFDEEVRAIEVKIFTKLGEKTEVNSVNMKTNKGELSRTMEILLPRNVEAYEYEITYFIKGKNPVKSPRKSSDYGRIDLDRFL